MNIHIGKRGLVLLMFGGVWASIGIGLRDAPQSRSIPLFHSIPMEWQAWAWIATGLLAIFLALTARNEWRGYPVLFPMPFFQAVGYGVGLFTNHLPLTGVVVWALLVGILFVLADWPEPPVHQTEADQ